jgi:lipoprotein-releasing system permease protein
MFRPFFAFVGYRYTYVKRKNHFISFISLTSAIGIALGVGVLITVLSVQNGFNREIRAQMLNGTPHITLTKMGGVLHEWKPLVEQLKAHPKIKGATPYIFGQGMLSNIETGRIHGTLVKGVNPNQIQEVYPLTKKMVKGELSALKPNEFGMLIGKTLASNMGVGVGDTLSLIAPEASVSPAGLMPRMKRFTVVGIFSIGDLYDANQIFIHLNDADKFFRMGGIVTGIQLKVEDEMEAPQVARDLYKELKEEYWLSDWTEDFGGFFKALKIQKTVMTFILLLIIAVAAFNLVSSLVMMVSDKRQDIAILRTLGASRRSIMGIFIAQGGLIGFLGTVLGVGLGVYLSLQVSGWADKIEAFFDIELVSKEVYLIGFLPSEIHSSDVMSIALITLVMSLLATLYPAYRAASVQPAEALRYE